MTIPSCILCPSEGSLSPPTRGSRVSWWVLCKVCLFTQLCPTLATPWAVAHQAALSMGFPGQEYWSGLPFASPRDLPNPGITACLLHWSAGSLPLSLQGSTCICTHIHVFPTPVLIKPGSNETPVAMTTYNIQTWLPNSNIY